MFHMFRLACGAPLLAKVPGAQAENQNVVGRLEFERSACIFPRALLTRVAPSMLLPKPFTDSSVL